jgi:hypothetical protein
MDTALHAVRVAPSLRIFANSHPGSSLKNASGCVLQGLDEGIGHPRCLRPGKPYLTSCETEGSVSDLYFPWEVCHDDPMIERRYPWYSFPYVAPIVKVIRSLKAVKPKLANNAIVANSPTVLTALSYSSPLTTAA